MHHFIYPSKDTYITNETNYLSKNLGLDEILEIKANTQLYRNVTVYQTASISQNYSVESGLYLFTGLVNGYLSGSTINSNLLINSDANIQGTLSFTGLITGSLNGTTTTASVSNQTGRLSGSLSGSISGSWTGVICDASGSVSSFTGLIQGAGIGTGSVYSPSISFETIPALSRALLKFDVSAISKSIVDGTIKNTGSLKVTLKMEIVQASEIPLSYSMYAYPVSQSWEMGDGYYETSGSNLGASWYYKDFSGESGNYWYTITGSTTYKFVDYFNTASYASESFNKGGGTWYYNVPSTYISASSGYCHTISASNSLIARQDFNYEKSNLGIDVSEIVKSWICGCIPNEGLIILTSLELSKAETTKGTFKFFSKDTNTIYTPYLDVQWDDSSYVTGSLVAVSESNPFTVILRNLNKNYKFGAIPRIDVYSRPKNPLKNFVKGYQMNQFLTSSLLPTSSYYCIKDNESESIIVDFDESTKLSCDGNMHYFVLDTTSFAQERFYRILVKVVTNNEEQIFDNGYIFKVTR
jgi:hypothetical protein